MNKYVQQQKLGVIISATNTTGKNGKDYKAIRGRRILEYAVLHGILPNEGLCNSNGMD